MKVIVMGAGLLGVTSAYYLARAGYEVTVIDRQSEPAKETSFANAGLISPGHAYAWASPQAPMTLLKSLWSRDTSLRYRLRLDPAMWLWSLKFLAYCTAPAYRRHTLTKLKLCVYSQAQTELLAHHEGLEWDRTKKGILYLFRDEQHFIKAQTSASILRDKGITVTALAKDDILAIEPALEAMRDKMIGALFTPGDETGDARKFTLALAEKCKALGVIFEFGNDIISIATGEKGIAHLQTRRGDRRADYYVLALGSYSPLLVRKLGIKMPIYPIKGYSVTVPLADSSKAPTLGGVDETYLVAFSRLGDRLRVTGTAEFSGYDPDFAPDDFGHMLGVAKELFPQAAYYDQPSYWACLRPTTADGPPVIGPSPVPNLWLNTGHGHLGWTMAAGSSRLLADMMQGKKTELDMSGLTYERYHR